MVILAGGLATRLHPITETIPKALIDINGKPFILHQLELLKQSGFSQVILCVGFLGQQIEAVVGNGQNLGLSVIYSYDFATNSGTKNLLGTGGAIKKALPLLDNHFFVMYGDSYLPCNYAHIQNAFCQQQRPALMTVFHNQGLWDKSNVKYENQQILVYDKKSTDPELSYIDYGLGVFEKKAFNKIPDESPYDLADLYQTLLKENELSAYEVNTRFYEIGSFNGIMETCAYLKNTINSPSPALRASSPAGRGIYSKENKGINHELY